MTTVLQLLGLWVVLSALVTAGVCLVVRGGNLHAERCVPAVPLTTPRTRPLAAPGRPDAALRDADQSLTA
jgi:hypothetical protein